MVPPTETSWRKDFTKGTFGLQYTEMITDHEVAKRKARAIASDILLYHKDKVRQGLEQDNLFDVCSDEFQEGREYYNKFVSPEIRQSTNYYDRALVDVLIKRNSDVETKIW